ncbi:MAG: hypothetical protein J0M03_20945 [Acidobacteria bacterium]|nr:hypothetical protein [Acidobacteriota bacterium]
MVLRLSIFLIFLSLLVNSFVFAQGEIIHSDAEKYLEFLREEQAELDFQLKHKEISHPIYKRASTRISILKELITKYGQDSEQYKMPEYHVAIEKDLELFILDGQKKLKNAKPNQIIDKNWRFVKTITRGETFYILERLNNNP